MAQEVSAKAAPYLPTFLELLWNFFFAIPTECERNDLLPTPFVKGNLAVSHLLFADDVLIFASASIEAASNLRRLL